MVRVHGAGFGAVVGLKDPARPTAHNCCFVAKSRGAVVRHLICLIVNTITAIKPTPSVAPICEPYSAEGETVSEQVTPTAEKVEEVLASLHAQLYLMRSQVAAWQRSSTASGAMKVEDEKTEKAFSLMEECCQMDWEIGQRLLEILHAARGTREQKDSFLLHLMGTPSPILSKSLPNGMPHRHPSFVVAASSSPTAN
jgi:hypothetical protein